MQVRCPDCRESIEIDNVELSSDMKCLEKDPRRRYVTAAALAEDLERFLAGKPILAHPTPVLVRAQRWCHRNWVVAALTSGLLAVLVLGLFATTAQWSRAERNAAREAQLREQVEKLTRELLELAEQLQSEKPAPLPKSVAAGFGGTAHDSPAPADDAATGMRAGPPRLAQMRVDAEAPTAPRVTALRAEAESKLQELNQLAPGVAKRFRRFVQP